MAREGWQVDVVEKNETAGGRARQFISDGFVFDMGPSWYWMPDVFERFFSDFGKKVIEHYELVRLSPGYRVFFKDDSCDVPASLDELYTLFEKYEPGSSSQLK